MKTSHVSLGIVTIIVATCFLLLGPNAYSMGGANGERVDTKATGAGAGGGAAGGLLTPTPTAAPTSTPAPTAPPNYAPPPTPPPVNPGPSPSTTAAFPGL